MDAEVDARLEAAEIHRRVIAAGGPALLFTHVRGAEFPLVTNLFGTRAARRAGVRPPAGPARSAGSSSWPRRCCRRRPASSGARATSPSRRCASGSAAASAGPVTEVVTRDVRLDRLPVLTSWPEDGGPFLTLPLVYTEHPERPGRTTSASTACRSTTRARRACTGRSARAAASTTRRPKRAARACR